MKKIGPGGIKCSCCRPRCTVQYSKRLLNRQKRRAAKLQLKKELQEK